MNTVDDLPFDEATVCNVFFGPGWWPAITPDQCQELIDYVESWCVANDLSNLDFLITATQITAPID